MVQVIDKVIGGAYGVLLGDALGQPAECLKPELIRLRNKGPVRGFIAPLQKRPPMENLEIGDWTDDWDFSELLLQSYSRCRGYNLIDIAWSHVDFMESGRARGMGQTTERGLKELSLWRTSKGQEGRSPFVAPDDLPDSGAGNGVAMKILPVALWAALTHRSSARMFLETRSIAKLTHSKLEAATSAYALALAYRSLFEKTIKTRDEAGDLLDQLLRVMQRLEDQAQSQTSITPVSQLQRLRELLGDPEAIAREITPGFTAITSVFCALGWALCFLDDFEAGVLFAVNAGGDADSTASMVGALLGVNLGYQAIREDWREFRPDYRRAYDTALCFYEAAATQ